MYCEWASCFNLYCPFWRRNSGSADAFSSSSSIDMCFVIFCPVYSISKKLYSIKIVLYTQFLLIIARAIEYCLASEANV